MLKKIQKEVEDLRIKVYAGQSLEDTEKALYEIEQMLFKAMDEQLNIPIVSQRSKLLKAEDKDVPFDDYIKRFFKKPKMELIYRSKRNNNMMTESQLIKYYKRAMCL